MRKFDSSDPTKTYFIAIGAGYYGLGLSIDEALRKRRAAGGRGKRKELHLMRFPQGAHSISVGSDGSVYWEGVPGSELERVA